MILYCPTNNIFNFNYLQIYIGCFLATFLYFRKTTNIKSVTFLKHVTSLTEI